MSSTSPFLPQGSPQCRVTELSVPASKVVNGIAQIYSWCLERPLASPGRSTCTTEINRYYGSIMSIGDASQYASYYTITSPSSRFFSSDTAPYCVDVSPSDSMTWEASSVESQNKLCFSSSPCPTTTTSSNYPDNYDSCDWFCKFFTFCSIASAAVTLATHPHHASALTNPNHASAPRIRWDVVTSPANNTGASWYWWFPWTLIGCVVCCIGACVARLQRQQGQRRRTHTHANIAPASASTTTVNVSVCVCGGGGGGGGGGGYWQAPPPPPTPPTAPHLLILTVLIAE